MSELIKELKSEHLEIIDALKEVKEFGILTFKGQAKLMSVKAILLEHLKKEDEKLYPFFYKIAEQDKKLKDTLELFAADLENLSRIVIEFFNTFSNGDLDTKFVDEFEDLFVALCKRMRYEEFLLFDEYEEFNQH